VFSPDAVAGAIKVRCRDHREKSINPSRKALALFAKEKIRLVHTVYRGASPVVSRLMINAKI
jgi:hypothetical protein